MPIFKYRTIAVSCGALSLLSLLTIRSRKQKNVQPNPLLLQNQISTSRNLGKTSGISLDGIRAPADMWRFPSESWQPIELPSSCDDPTAQIDSETHCRKVFKICNKKRGSVPRYHGPGTGLTPSDLKAALRAVRGDIVLLGDSVTRQWFEQLSYYLGASESWKGFTKKPLEENRDALEAEITRTLLNFSERFRERGDIAYLLGSKFKVCVAFGSFQIPISSEGETARNVLHHSLQYLTLEEVADLIIYYTEEYPRKFNRDKTILVINIGLWYNKSKFPGLPKNDNDLLDDLKFLTRVCTDRKAKCIFRETSPQHFLTPAGDGLYAQGSSGCMKEPPASFDTLDRWRNDMLYDVVGEVTSKISSKSGKKSFLKVMPLFDRLAGLSAAHIKMGGDCTHYYSDPAYWEPWHLSLTEVLTDIAGTINDSTETF